MTTPGRSIERRIFAAALDEAARRHFDGGLAPWHTDALLAHRYCLLASFRRDGGAVPTPLWFAAFEDGICFRTAAESAKVARMRREPEVAVAPCTWRGRPLGPAMRARASLLTGGREGAAELALQQRYGAPRAVYKRAVGDAADAVYFGVGPS